MFELLEILPRLRKGVIVHVHDIFSPEDYPETWMFKDMRLWNEQYLLEAFLTHNADWNIIGALHYLHLNHHAALEKAFVRMQENRTSSSFYMEKRA